MILFLFTTVAAFTASFIAKNFADATLHGHRSLIGSFIGLTYSQNPGIAFGIRLPDMFQEFFIIVALIFVCYLAWTTAQTTVSRIAYGLIAGGALGNIVDRIPDGLVTDFFQVGNFPIFNVADSCVTIGVVLLLAEIIIFGRNK